jgi:putative aldouronate transport system substrate-binding protein
MNNRIAKFVALLLCVVMVATMFAACTGGGGSDEFPINYDIDLTQKPKLNVLMPNSGRDINAVNSDNNALLIQQLTGYEVEYTQLPAADSSKVLNNELMDKRNYQAMKLTKDQFSDLVKDDMLVDITDALAVFAPDILASISEESWDVVTVNGRIYGIPERASSDNIENMIVFNQDLLLQNNLDIPTTLVEFENVLQVLTAAIGKPALTFDKYTPLVYSISAAFGIYSTWQEYEVNGETQVLFYMNAPRYQEYVDYMNKLYKAGYIDVEVGTNTAADAISKFTNNKAACVACSLWSVSSIVTGLQANGTITSVEAAGTMENYLGYLRALKANASDPEHVYRASGYTYITAIPYYQAENAGYALDWMNSKIKDTEEAHNFRSIVLGEEDKHWTYSPSEGYLPINANFGEKDTASYYLTGSNEKVYTQYWLARVRKQPELFRAWSIMMENADQVGVYNVVDFTPPIEDYNSNRSAMEEYAQDQFYIMMKDGTGKLQEFLNKLNSLQGGSKATDAINAWYKEYKK